ncbi:MAG: hypothetical protein U1F68_08990 [Gammaproteobacteria bacterium]
MKKAFYTALPDGLGREAEVDLPKDVTNTRTAFDYPKKVKLRS